MKIIRQLAIALGLGAMLTLYVGCAEDNDKKITQDSGPGKAPASAQQSPANYNQNKPTNAGKGGMGYGTKK